MKSLKTLYFLLFLLISKSAFTQGKINIFDKNKTNYSILIEPNALESVSEAAKDLQRIVKKSSGIELPIVNQKTTGNYIVIGDAAKQYGVDVSGFEHDEFLIKEIKGDIILYGKDEDIRQGYNEVEKNDFYKFYNIQRWRRTLSAGSYNAHIQFVMDNLGVRWFMPTEKGEVVPKLSKLDFQKGFDKKFTPFFKQRRLDCTDWTRQKMQATTKDGNYHRRENTDAAVMWGRHMRHTNPVVLENGHGWRQWIPADQISKQILLDFTSIPKTGYGKTNPEFFALNNGVRQVRYTSKVQHGGQLCMSNPELIKTYAQNIIDYNKGNPTVKIFSLCQNDGGSHCECDNCRAWDSTPQDMTKPSHEQNLTDRYLKFQKAVSDIVTKTIPDAKIMAIAYHETGNAPTRESVPDNFYVQGFYNYFPYLYNIEHERKDLEHIFPAWGKSAKNYMYSSFYFAYGNYSLPWSSYDAQKWLIDLFAKNNIKYFETLYEGEYPMMGQLGPDQYVVSQLLWNPNQSADELANEWYKGSFGTKAGALVKQYFEMLNAKFKKEIMPNFMQNRGKFQQDIDLAVYYGIEKEATDLMNKIKEISVKEDADTQWRIKQITTTWDFTVLTLRAIEAGKKYRINPNPETFKLAFDLGKQRESMISNSENCFAISPRCVESSDNNSTLNIISKELNLEKREITVYKQEQDFKVGKKTWVEWEPLSSAVGRKMDKQEFRDNITSQKANADGFTLGRIFYTDKGLYVAMSMAEPRIDSIEVSNDPKNPWKGDCVEIFLNPTGAKDEYYQFVVNPNNLGSAVAKKGDVGLDKSYSPKWEHIVNKSKQAWQTQIFIPWEDLGGKPKDGDSWGVNFYRTKWKPAQKEYLAWAPTGTKLFAMPEMFGKMVFGGKR
jgi:Domain of unknown function (DUF4838)/Carbohydrate family 9 binding domain-like